MSAVTDLCDLDKQDAHIYSSGGDMVVGFHGSVSDSIVFGSCEKN